MNTLYCDLCKVEIPPLEHHDFAKQVYINGIGGDYYRADFEICDSCEIIWKQEAQRFVDTVKMRCNPNISREKIGIKPDWFPEEMAGYNSIQEVKKQRNPTLQAMIDWLNKK